jgi:hypothetical protein
MTNLDSEQNLGEESAGEPVKKRELIGAEFMNKLYDSFLKKGHTEEEARLLSGIKKRRVVLPSRG